MEEQYQTIIIDNLEWGYDYDSDSNLPIITEDMVSSECVKFFSETIGDKPDDRQISFRIFEELPIKNLKCNFNLSFDFIEECTLEKIETTGMLNFHDTTLNCPIIICNRFRSFSSKFNFKRLKVDILDFRLTEVEDSENDSVGSEGYLHTDHGVVLSRNKFDLDVKNIIHGLTIID